MVYVRVDASEVVDEIGDEDLVRELVSRGFTISAPKAKIEKLKKWDADIKLFPAPEACEELEGGLREVRDLLLAGRTPDALLTIDRLLAPRFDSPAACEAAYRTLRATTSDVGHRT